MQIIEQKFNEIAAQDRTICGIVTASHFDPQGIDPESIQVLRNFSSFLRQLCVLAQYDSGVETEENGMCP